MYAYINILYNVKNMVWLSLHYIWMIKALLNEIQIIIILIIWFCLYIWKMLSNMKSIYMYYVYRNENHLWTWSTSEAKNRRFARANFSDFKRTWLPFLTRILRCARKCEHFSFYNVTWYGKQQTTAVYNNIFKDFQNTHFRIF